jgi:DNA-binding response OmpR family regulator
MRVLITETTWNAMAAAKDLAAARFRLSRADDAEELLEFVRNGAQDAALVSTRLPDASAAETLVRLRRLAPRLPAIVLSDGPLAGADRKALYEAGADAVLGLPMEPAELAARIRAMVLRAAGYATSRVCIGGLELDPVTRSACVGRRSVRLPGDGCHGARRIPLSPREYDVLELLVLARGRTVDRAEVMDRLYAFEDEPGPRIVDVYVARIRAKLARAGLAPGMIVSIRGRGLLLAPAGPPPSGRAGAATAA